MRGSILPMVVSPTCTASRVSLKRERKMRFFQPDAYISIDYDQRRAQIFHKPAPGAGWLDIRARIHRNQRR